MTIKNCITEIEKRIPLAQAENFDNVGLLCGNPEREVTGILICHDALENVIDPELGIDIMNLGLVYDVKMSDDNKHAIVDMTLTSMGCPLAPVIIEQVETAMLGVDEIEKVDVNIVWEPAWTKDRMSRYAKIALGVIDYE